jgi:hypothetical protein
LHETQRFFDFDLQFVCGFWCLFKMFSFDYFFVGASWMEKERVTDEAGNGKRKQSKMRRISINKNSGE